MNFDLLMDGMAVVLSPQVFFYILLGVAGGTLLGALPGLTATMGVALLVPFTFALPVESGIGMLLGIFQGAMYGGSIPAVLIRTPGTPAAAATALDGYPMGQKGEAARALAMSLYSSVLGSFIGVFAMIWLSPQISRFALKFSTAEFFCLAIFGLSVVTSISGRSLVKGMMSAFFGLLLCCVGSDPISGYARYIFGNMQLYEGPPFIPTLIGLFAVSEVFAGIERSGAVEKVKNVVKTALPSKADAISSLPCIIKSSIIGTIIGAIPGCGGDIAAYVAYGDAKRASKHPEEFGKGALNGIAAPEAANNGVVGGAMIPLLSLGIPGDAVTAIVLSAFTIQGMQPGPLMYVDHLEDVYYIFAGMFVACFLVYIVGVVGMRFFVKLISVKKNFLLPCIMIMSLVGAYAMRNSIFDVYCALFFGVVGYLFQKKDFPLSPILLALILGPMAESNLRRTLIITDSSFSFLWDRPICLLLVVLSLVSLGISLYNQKRIAKNELAQQLRTVETDGE